MVTAFNTYDYSPSVYTTAWFCGQGKTHPILRRDFASFRGEEFKVKCNIVVISNSLSNWNVFVQLILFNSGSWHMFPKAQSTSRGMYLRHISGDDG